MIDKPQHPGSYVRENVIPKTMNVTKAAERLGVSRPTLSNFLNGKADLSTEMATRLEVAFGVPARKLLDLQSAWDAARTERPKLAPTIKSYVPPFLQIKAKRIEAWAGSGLLPRQRLSVFLRTLVNSTGTGLTKVDFPGNDDSERAGWDGEVVASAATPWIPEGRSGWEFGVNQDPKKKADGDYAKSVAGAEAVDRKEMTFVFVTPRNWPGKSAWVKERKAENLWKDVRAYDSSDLEQWLEQSIPAQAWFANETGQAEQGAVSLDQAWKQWVADSEPALKPSLFTHAIETHQATLLRGVSADKPSAIIISADSRDEALAFLSSAFSAENAELGQYRDRIIVFEQPGTLSKLAAEVSNFIPVISSREVEKEFAPFRGSMPSFIVYPRNATTEDPDIALETLNYEVWDRGLQAMGLKHERIAQLSHETGRSPTVLRRRLSRLPAIQTPDWASDKKLAAMLVPFLFAGAWKVGNKADEAMMEALAGDVPFSELERRIALLLPLDSTPVWSLGSFRGVVSKIDILFAIGDVILAADLQRFFEVADLVLSEDDPALELPEDKQWAAGIYGKTREISGALREGLAETLVLLAVHGPKLFRKRLSFDPSVHANRLVQSLLTPLTLRKLESQSGNLPLYSEAAPETFLKIIEADLESPDPHSLGLMRPMGDTLFGRSPRTGLLWALENLAWSDQLFIRTVLVLGRLSERSIDDNLVNKPIGSLGSIFRSWMPQTSANLDHRKAALEKLAEKHPAVAWPICIEQISAHSTIGHHSHKPRWRPDGHGYGNPITEGERNEFALHAFRMALNWPHHTRETIGDLVANLEGLEESLKLEVWDKVDAWSEGASEADRAGLREKIRVSAFSRRAVKRRRGAAKGRSDDRARAAYDRLQPRDPIHRHEWLFRTSWVDESWEEITAEDFDYRKRDERIAALRKDAVREVFEEGGVEAIVRLAEMGQAAHNAGWSLARLFQEEGRHLAAELLRLAQGGPLTGARGQVLSGALAASTEVGSLVKELVSNVSEIEAVPLLVQAPFQRSTWDIVEELGATTKQRYWAEIEPGWNRNSDDIGYAVAKLVEVGRPRAAFAFAHFDLKELAPTALFELMAAITRSGEPAKTYMLDPHYICDAFDLLNASGQFSTDEMSGLEYAYIDVFDRDARRLINLERRVEEQPDIYVQAVAFAYKRDDDGEDPSELRVEDDEQRSARALGGYKLLENLRRLPSAGEDGVPKADELLRWIEQVRAGCAALARTTSGDKSLGKLLSHSPAAPDEVWPCAPVRDVLEQVLNEDVDQGLHIALYNSRGAHFRGEGGGAEREIAAEYGSWAKALEYTHPHVAAFLRSMEKAYLHDAEWHDNDARIGRRMRL